MLILAATPIGNLEDATPRLERALREADAVYAEDTRQSRKLLAHFGIRRTLASFHDFSRAQVLDRIAEQLRAGATLVYLSDAGTPAISDPGFELVRLAHRLEVEVDALPGPCAAVNALVLSGLPSHEFCFLGFFPAKQEQREALIPRLAALAMTSIFYEAPSRIQHSLNFLAERLPRLELAVCREMTKRHQQVLRGRAVEVLAGLTRVKGEFALLLGPVTETPDRPDLEQRRRQLLAEGLSPTQVAKRLAKEFNLAKRDLYRALHQTPDEPDASAP